MSDTNKKVFTDEDLTSFTNAIIEMVIDKREQTGQVGAIVLMAIDHQGADNLMDLSEDINEAESEDLRGKERNKSKWGLAVAQIMGDAMENDHSKEACVEAISKMIAASKPKVVAFVTEGFIKQVAKEDYEKYQKENKGKRISEIEGNKEVLFFHIETADGRKLMPMYEIVYPANDKLIKPLLIEMNDDAKLKQYHAADDKGLQVEGIFSNFYKKAKLYSQSQSMTKELITDSKQKLEDILKKYGL